MTHTNKKALLARAMAAAMLVLGATAAQAASAVPGMGTWESTLQGRDLDGNAANGFEAYYDTSLNISWLADANYANTIGYVSPTFNVGGGFMTWDEGMALVQSLDIGGVTGWRAPTLKDIGKPGCENYGALGGSDCGYNVDPSTSELAHLYHVTLGNKSALAPDGSHRADGDFGLINVGPFKNVQTLGYGIGTPYAPDSTKIWAFNPSSGIQTYLNKTSAGFGWAVHDGDVGSAVPEPQSAALMLLGLAGVATLARRKR